MVVRITKCDRKFALKFSGKIGDSFLFPNAIEEPATADEELVADDGWGCVKPVVELVGGQGLQFFPVFEDQRHSVTARDIDLASGCHGRAVDIGQTLETFTVDESVASLGISTGQDGLTGLVVIKQTTIKDR